MRETRRVAGDYVLTLDDYQARRSFDDEIARNSYPIDIHGAQKHIKALLSDKNVCAMNHFGRYGKGESHGIPYRCLLPQKLDNVLVAGRCISTDRLMLGSTRVMPVCLVTGEAAGIAAALAARSNGRPRDIDVTELRAILKRNGAYIR